MPYRSTSARRFAGIAVCTLATVAACSEAPTAASSLNLRMAKGAATSSEVPVVSNLDGSGLVANRTLQSDGKGVYTNCCESVVSIIQSLGDWTLDQRATKSTRTTSISLAQQISGTTPPFTTALVKARFFSGATRVGKTYTGMVSGQVEQFPLVVAFDYGGKSYRLAMNPQNNAGTDFASVTCTAPATAGAPCTAWQLAPSGASGQNTAILFLVAAKGDSEVGRFLMKFDITLSK